MWVKSHWRRRRGREEKGGYRRGEKDRRGRGEKDKRGRGEKGGRGSGVIRRERDGVRDVEYEDARSELLNGGVRA